MNNRIKEVRLGTKLNQEAFGKRLKITKASISRLESGINHPSDQTISLICSEFNIDEHWLRTGEGSPNRKLTPSEEIENIVRNLLDYSKNYCSKVQAGLANNKERLICPSNKLNIDDEVQRYREELELEARQAGKSSAYENTGEINKKQA